MVVAEAMPAVAGSSAVRRQGGSSVIASNRSLLAALSAVQGNAVDAFGPTPVRFLDAPVGLGTTDCCRSTTRLSCGKGIGSTVAQQER